MLRVTGSGIEKVLNCVNLRFVGLIRGKYLNGRTLESFAEVCAGPPGQLSRWTCFAKITNKKVIAENQAKIY